jgi:hypothetical protein
MPISTGVGRASVGRDCTLVVQGPFGRVDLPNVMSFDSKQETATVKVDRLDGQQIHGELPKGWSGSFENERGNSGLDDLFANIEAAWYNSGSVAVSTMYQYVQEPDGATSTYAYDNVTLKLDDAGAWKGDASVKQKVSFYANRRRRV